jgi:hypothetical protein
LHQLSSTGDLATTIGTEDRMLARTNNNPGPAGNNPTPLVPYPDGYADDVAGIYNVRHSSAPGVEDQYGTLYCVLYFLSYKCVLASCADITVMN